MIRVVLIEDQAMVCGALSALLELEDDITVIGQAGDGRSGLMMIDETSPDVVLTDVEMPEKNGLELAAELSQRPNPPKLVILTTFARSLLVGESERDQSRLRPTNPTTPKLAATAAAVPPFEPVVTRMGS